MALPLQEVRQETMVPILASMCTARRQTTARWAWEAQRASSRVLCRMVQGAGEAITEVEAALELAAEADLATRCILQ